MSFDVRVTPASWTPRGEARLTDRHGKPLLVFGGIPGENGQVWVYHDGDNQALGLWRGAETPHKSRVEPPCERYAACGGCPLMHLDNSGQWDARESLVKRALREVGLEKVVVGARYDSPDGLENYRHVIKVGAGYSDQGSMRLGAWGRRTRSIVPIPKCNVTTPTLRRLMSALAHHAIEHDIRPYDEETDRGVLRAVVARQSRHTGEVIVTLVVGRKVRELQDYAEAIANDVTDVTGIWLHINDEPGNAIFHPDEDGAVGVKPLVGKPVIEEMIGDISYLVGPGDFFQTNPAVAQVLYKRAVERLNLNAEAVFLDLYAGVGGLALQAARHAGWTLGVEEVEGAVGRARENARRNNLTAEFICGKVADLIPDVRKRLAGRRPVLSVNPARRGLEEGVVAAIAELQPRRIAYVSCNPQALARDLAAFVAAGFEVGEVELFDMFPNTAHVECLVTLTGVDPDEPGRPAPRRRVVRR
jgi:23S rRNA (uracil1939-C5)-methyltransferase